MAPGPASWAARHAPNNQPEPMMEPKPVNISAMAPTSRRIALSLDINDLLPATVAALHRSALCPLCLGIYFRPLNPTRGAGRIAHQGSLYVRQNRLKSLVFLHFRGPDQL